MNTSSRTKAVLYMIVLFAAGTIFGAMTFRRTPPPPPQPLKLGRASEISARIRDKLTAKLKLTPEQLTKADPLFQQAGQKIEDAHAQCLTKIDHALGDLHQSMLPFLTDSQIPCLRQIEAARADSMLQKYGYHAASNTVALPPAGTLTH